MDLAGTNIQKAEAQEPLSAVRRQKSGYLQNVLTEGERGGLFNGARAPGDGTEPCRYASTRAPAKHFLRSRSVKGDQLTG